MNLLFVSGKRKTPIRQLLSLYARGGSENPGDGYVTDGLVFRLDGIRKGEDNTKWVDLVGNKEITLANCTFTETGVNFSASNSYGLLNGVSTGVLPAEGTIEACLSGTQTFPSALFCLLRGENTAIRFYFAGPSHRIEMNENSSATSWNGIPVSGFEKMTASMNEDRAFFNGEALTATTGRTWMSNISNPCIIIGGSGGTSNPASGGHFDGLIHSIRIYNRKLSEAEILQNQKVDNTRFSLGLDIA